MLDPVTDIVHHNHTPRFKRPFLLTLLYLLGFLPSYGHSNDSYTRPRDFSAWYSTEVEKSTFKDQYVAIQLQLRYDNNATTFDRTNLTFTYGYDWTKNFNLEAAYRMNFNYDADQQTFYLGAARKFRINSRMSLYFRTALQHTRNHFTGDFEIDQPITQWRNRLRLNYRFDVRYSMALSAEPYLLHDGVHQLYVSRIRYQSQFSMRLNKYNSLTVFYLLQPDVVDYGINGTSNVAGITYSIDVPGKLSNFSRIYSGKNKRKK